MTAIHRREMLGIMLGGAAVATVGLAMMSVPAESAPLTWRELQSFKIGSANAFRKVPKAF